MMLVAMVLLVAGGAIWFIAGHEERIAVRGNLSARDLAEIKRAVRSELRKEILPDFSWRSIKSVPSEASKYLQRRIKVVVQAGDTNAVFVGFGNSERPFDSFSLIRGTNGWRVNLDDWRLIPQIY